MDLDVGLDEEGLVDFVDDFEECLEDLTVAAASDSVRDGIFDVSRWSRDVKQRMVGGWR